MNSYDRVYNLLLEYSGEHPIGKFDRTSALTPQRDALHNLKANRKKAKTLKDKIKVNYGAAKEFVSNARDIKRKIDASPKRTDVHFAKEGGQDSWLEKATKVYSWLKGRKFSADTLEHPDYDPDIKGNKGERVAAKKMTRLAKGRGMGDKEAEEHGKKVARDATEYAFSGDPDKQKPEKAYHQSDWEDHDLPERPKKPSEHEIVQQDRNRMRRRGAAAEVRRHQRAGRTVVGTMGAGHWRDVREALLEALQFRRKV